MTQMSQVGDVPSLSHQKQELLIALYQVCWGEMTWRRNAGYRTVILGLAYCGLLLAGVAVHPINVHVRMCLSGVIVLASLFGAGYLIGNYKSYMSAASRAVAIEDYVGAFDSDFLGKLGPLMQPGRRAWPRVPLTKDMKSLWSVIVFAVGGLGTALGIMLL
jgi:hypothetical protein